MNRLFSLLIVLTLSAALKTPASARYYPAVDPFITTENAQRLKAMRKISPAAMHSIEPVIRDWLQFYHLDISKFYLGKKVRGCFIKIIHPMPETLTPKMMMFISRKSLIIHPVSKNIWITNSLIN